VGLHQYTYCTTTCPTTAHLLVFYFCI